MQNTQIIYPGTAVEYDILFKQIYDNSYLSYFRITANGHNYKIDLDKIREFQRKTYDLTHAEKEFKPLPPDYNVDDVFKRIDNESLLS